MLLTVTVECQVQLWNHEVCDACELSLGCQCVHYGVIARPGVAGFHETLVWWEALSISVALENVCAFQRLAQ